MVVKAQFRGGFSLGQPEDFPPGVGGWWVGGEKLGLKLNLKLGLNFAKSIRGGRCDGGYDGSGGDVGG